MLINIFSQNCWLIAIGGPLKTWLADTFVKTRAGRINELIEKKYDNPHILLLQEVWTPVKDNWMGYIVGGKVLSHVADAFDRKTVQDRLTQNQYSISEPQGLGYTTLVDSGLINAAHGPEVQVLSHKFKIYDQISTSGEDMVAAKGVMASWMLLAQSSSDKSLLNQGVCILTLNTHMQAEGSSDAPNTVREAQVQDILKVHNELIATGRPGKCIAERVVSVIAGDFNIDGNSDIGEQLLKKMKENGFTDVFDWGEVSRRPAKTIPELTKGKNPHLPRLDYMFIKTASDEVAVNVKSREITKEELWNPRRPEHADKDKDFSEDEAYRREHATTDHAGIFVELDVTLPKLRPPAPPAGSSGGAASGETASAGAASGGGSGTSKARGGASGGAIAAVVVGSLVTVAGAAFFFYSNRRD